MIIFSRLCRFGFLCAALLTPLQSLIAEGSSDPVSRFIEDSEAYIKLRYRFEHVEQDSFSKDATASTLRSVLGLRSAEVGGLKAHVEIEDVSDLGVDSFNNTINGEGERPVIADVDGTEVNILTLTSSHLPNSTTLLGRYHKVLDNARFIGDVVWRQNHQTFDGATFTNTSMEDTEFFYGYMWNINRIYGDDSPVGNLDSANHLFHLNFSGFEETSISIYSYLLDLEDLAAQSSRTSGGLLTGAYPAGDNLTILYDVEYARQSDYGNNPASYDANYYRISTGIGYDSYSFSGGVESLGSDSEDVSFSTPLATLHMWNGWADMFLNTPAEGLEDTYAKFSYTHEKSSGLFGDASLALVYHHFESERGSTKFGTEWDLDFVQNFLEKYYFGVRLAHFNSRNWVADTTKLIFSVGASFDTLGP